MAGFERAVVVGAAGGFGRVFVRLLAGGGTHVTAVDVAGPFGEPADTWITTDATAGDVALIRAVTEAELLVVCLPEDAAFAALTALVPVLDPDALVVDIMSVKSPVAQWVRDVGPRPGVLSLNPLFAPDLGFEGRPVAAVTLQPGGDQAGFIALLEGAGAEVLTMTADEHDRDAAASQVLTHVAVLAAGMALGRHPDGPLPRTATPPHRALVLLLARILGGSSEVYWNIQFRNPHAEHARRLLAESLAELGEVVSAGRDGDFTRLLDTVRTALGDELGALAAQSARLLASIPLTTTDRGGHDRTRRPPSP